MATEDDRERSVDPLYGDAPSTYELTLRLRVRDDEQAIRGLFDADHRFGRIRWLTVYRRAHSEQFSFAPDERIDVVGVERITEGESRGEERPI